MALQLFKEKSKKTPRKDDKNLCFSTDFKLFYHFGITSFQKINRSIVSSINRFFVNFSSFSWFLLENVVSPNLKIQFFNCIILTVQTMCCENVKLDFPVDQPQLIPKDELCLNRLNFSYIFHFLKMLKQFKIG
jgi:hypothetical protein